MYRLFLAHDTKQAAEPECDDPCGICILHAPQVILMRGQVWDLMDYTTLKVPTVQLKGPLA